MQNNITYIVFLCIVSCSLLEGMEMSFNSKELSQADGKELIVAIDSKQKKIGLDDMPTFPNRCAWKNAAVIQKKRAKYYLRTSKFGSEVFNQQEFLRNPTKKKEGADFYTIQQRKIYSYKVMIFEKSKDLLLAYKAPLLKRIFSYFDIYSKKTEIDQIRKKIIALEQETNIFYKKTLVDDNIRKFESHQIGKSKLGLSQLLQEDILCF